MVQRGGGKEGEGGVKGEGRKTGINKTSDEGGWKELFDSLTTVTTKQHLLAESLLFSSSTPPHSLRDEGPPATCRLAAAAALR